MRSGPRSQAPLSHPRRKLYGMAKLVVAHRGYGSDTDVSCWGHTVIVPDDASPESHRALAEEAIRSTEGAEHADDLDWERSVVIAD